MQLSWLADVLRAEGCKVEEHLGWKTRTLKPFTAFQPIGLIDHHTAGSSVLPNYPDPPFYRNVALQDKCNLTIRPDGVCVTVNAGYAADSGYGDRRVLAAVKADAPLPAPTDTYSDLNPVTPGGSNPGVSGNPWYIDIEVQHLGDGSPIVPVQRAALIKANAAICRKMGWNPLTRVIGHREWSKRKTDPRWGGNTNPMPGIRTDTLQQMTQEEDMPLTEAEIQKIADRVWDRRVSRSIAGVTTKIPAIQELADIKTLLLDPADLAQRIAAAGLADKVIAEIKKLTYKAV